MLDAGRASKPFSVRVYISELIGIMLTSNIRCEYNSYKWVFTEWTSYKENCRCMLCNNLPVAFPGQGIIAELFSLLSGQSTLPAASALQMGVSKSNKRQFNLHSFGQTMAT